VLPHDVSELTLDVLHHRVVLSYEALAGDIDADAVITRVLRSARARGRCWTASENIPALLRRHTRRAAPVTALHLLRTGNLR